MSPMQQWAASVEARLTALGAPARPDGRSMPLGRCRSIAEAVCVARGMDLGSLLGPRGNAAMAEARMMALHLCVRHAQRSLCEIGRLFRRHHTTVMHADRTIHARAAKEPLLARELDAIARIAGIAQGEI